MAEILEVIMIVSFGASWPMNVIKSWKARTTKGKSLAFLVLIDFGYICGITAKIIAGNIVWYVLFFYILNFCMVATDIALYLHYRKLEKAQQ